MPRGAAGGQAVRLCMAAVLQVTVHAFVAPCATALPAGGGRGHVVLVTGANRGLGRKGGAASRPVPAPRAAPSRGGSVRGRAQAWGDASEATAVRRPGNRAAVRQAGPRGRADQSGPAGWRLGRGSAPGACARVSCDGAATPVVSRGRLGPAVSATGRDSAVVAHPPTPSPACPCAHPRSMWTGAGHCRDVPLFGPREFV